jgi:hypothetical protein
VSSLPPVIELDEAFAHLQFIANQRSLALADPIGQQRVTGTRALRSAKQLLHDNKLQRDRSYDLLYECDIIPFQQDAPLPGVGLVFATTDGART